MMFRVTPRVAVTQSEDCLIVGRYLPHVDGSNEDTASMAERSVGEMGVGPALFTHSHREWSGIGRITVSKSNVASRKVDEILGSVFIMV